MTQPQYQHISPAVLLDAAGQDTQVFVELIRTFLEIAPPMFERLRKAIGGGNLRVISLESHSLKSTVALIGAQQTSALLAQVEALSSRAEIDAIKALEAELTSLYTATEAEVRACLAYFSTSSAHDDASRAP